MGRQLTQAVIAGGVVYPAGTAEDDIAASEAIAEEMWGGGDSGARTSGSEPGHPNTALVREVCEYLIERHLNDVDVPVAELLAGVVEVFGEPEDGDDGDDGDDDDDDGSSGERITGDYNKSTAQALKAEIATRNEGRDEADQIPATGNKPDLVAALEDDDAASGQA